VALTDPLCRSFLDLWWHFDPAAATLAGVTGHDGRLGAFDAASFREHVAAFRSIAAAVEDLEVEETADEIDRTALLDHLRVLLFRFEHEHPYQRNPALWLEHFAAALEGLLARDPGDADHAAAALQRLRALPRFLSQARETLLRPPRFLVETALAQLAALIPLIGDTAERFGLAAAAVAEAKAELEQMAAVLEALDPDPDPHAAAIGEDEVDRRLHHEHASIHNAGEVWRAAMRLAGEIESEVAAFATAIDPARSWRELYELLHEESVVWNELSAELYESLEVSGQFAESRGLSASTPPLDVVPLSAAAAVLEPVASYRPAGVASHAALLVADPERASLSWLATRFGVPGVHLHRSRSDTLTGLVRRQIAATSTPLGWALYAQELMAELGFRPESEARLVERVLLLRDVHLAIADLGLHTKQFTPEEAVEHLTGHTPTDRHTALAHVRRLACRPTSACAAILGHQELRRLREDATRSRGAGFSLGDFHDELLGYGGLPVPLIRWGMGLDA
jgi:hypothetical protein